MLTLNNQQHTTASRSRLCALFACFACAPLSAGLVERRASVGEMRSEARRPYVTAIFQHGSWFGRAHSRYQDALPLRIPTMISGMCSLVIPRTGFRAVAAQKAEDGNATPADRNVQPSPLTSFQQLRGRVVQHWHSAEKYANNRYTSAENSTRQSTSPISDFPLPLLSTCFSLFLPSGSTARGIAEAIAA